MTLHAPPGPAHQLLPGAQGWPPGFDRLASPPARLRVLGRLPPWPRPVAIVGTRFADDDALVFARRLARELVAAGCAVLSGGAHGVDGAAHAGALEAGGITIAVLAHGFDQLYPRSHAGLFRRILAQGGALASERLDGSHIRRASFVQRNRLIAAMAEAIVVVQAPARSGALSTAAAGFSLGIPVFCDDPERDADHRRLYPQQCAVGEPVRRPVSGPHGP
jgi:DNA processing protein